MKKTNVVAIYGVILALLMYSCEEEKETYSITGNVKNVTSVRVDDATLSLSGDNGNYTITTDTEGSYVFNEVEEGDYTLTISATGYNNFDSVVTVASNMNMVHIIKGSAIISGTIINSQTGEGLSEATLTFSFSSGSKASNESNPEIVLISNVSGAYYISQAPSGVFDCTINKTGFSTRTIPNINISTGDNTIEQMILVESLDEGSYRVVLSWGDNPSDLDTHLTGPDGLGSRFHMYYSNMNPISNVSLDVDDTNSYGPETTTIYEVVDGTYRYSVFNYTDQSVAGASGIENSPARVEIYDYTGLLRTLTPPPSTGSDGNTWRVFEMIVSGSSVELITINNYQDASGDTDTDIFKDNKTKSPMSIKGF